MASGLSVFPICPDDSSIADFLAKADQLLLLVSIPLNILGIVCILFASRSHLVEMKWVFLNHQLWMLAFDITISGLVNPKYLVPLVAMYPQGLLSTLNSPPSISGSLIFAVSCGMTYCLIHILFQRYQSILPATHPRKLPFWTKYSFIAILYGSAVPFLYWFIDNIPEDAAKIKLEIATSVACIPKELPDPRTLVFSLSDGSATTFFIIIGGAIVCGMCGFFITESFKSLNHTRNNVSQQTKAALSRALVVLIVQSAVPLLFLAIPVGICACFQKMNIRSEVIPAACVFCAAFHSSIGTVVMITMNTSYRRFLIRSARKFGYQKKQISTVMINTL